MKKQTATFGILSLMLLFCLPLQAQKKDLKPADYAQ